MEDSRSVKCNSGMSMTVQPSITPEIQVTAPGHALPSSPHQLPGGAGEESSDYQYDHFCNPNAVEAVADTLRPSSASKVNSSTDSSNRLGAGHVAVRRHVRNLSLPPISRHVQDLEPAMQETSLTMSSWHVQDQNLSPSRYIQRFSGILQKISTYIFAHAPFNPMAYARKLMAKFFCKISEKHLYVLK